MDGIAKIGDVVFYNGETEHAFDLCTKELMVEFLIKGNAYTIAHIQDYVVVGDLYYRFEEIDRYIFPHKSFPRDIGLKYGLK